MMNYKAPFIPQSQPRAWMQAAYRRKQETHTQSFAQSSVITCHPLVKNKKVKWARMSTLQVNFSEDQVRKVDNKSEEAQKSEIVGNIFCNELRFLVALGYFSIFLFKVSTNFIQESTFYQPLGLSELSVSSGIQEIEISKKIINLMRKFLNVKVACAI